MNGRIVCENEVIENDDFDAEKIERFAENQLTRETNVKERKI